MLAEHDAYWYGVTFTAMHVRAKRHISHRTTHRIMKDAGRVTPSKARSRKRSWVRFERRYSNALWHVDWHVMKDPLFADTNLVVFPDDASRA